MRLLAAGALTIAALALGGCGGSHPITSLHLILDGPNNITQGPLYLQQARERFSGDNAVVKVKMLVPQDGFNNLAYISRHLKEIAFASEPEAIFAASRGGDIVVIGTLVRPPGAQMWLDKARGVTTPAQLAGKRVGAGSYNASAYLRTIMKTAGVPRGDYKNVNVGFNGRRALATGLVSGTVDDFPNQLPPLRPPPGIKATSVDKLGVPTFSRLVLVTNRRTLFRRADDLRKFIATLQQGTDDFTSNLDGALATIKQAGYTDQAALFAKQAGQLSLLNQPAGRPWGTTDVARWQKFADYMFASGLITRKVDAAQLVTNELLPGTSGKLTRPTGPTVTGATGSAALTPDSPALKKPSKVSGRSSY